MQLELRSRRSYL